MMADSITFIRYWNNASFLNNSGRWWTIADRWRGWAAPCFFVKRQKHNVLCGAARSSAAAPQPPHAATKKPARREARRIF
jgi:hypothetical protein